MVGMGGRRSGRARVRNDLRDVPRRTRGAPAALGVLAYGLADRMSREHGMIAERRRLEAGGEPAEGMSCTTCRPLILSSVCKNAFASANWGMS